MLKMPVALTAILTVCSLNVQGTLLGPEHNIVKRGDSNNDGTVNGADVSHLGNYLWTQDGPAPPCLNQADVNDDGAIDLSDQIYLLAWLFQGGPAPPFPGPSNTSCEKVDPALGCDVNPCST